MAVKRWAVALLGPTFLIWAVLSLVRPDAGHAESTSATGPGASMVGVWLTRGSRSQVEIAPCGDALCGSIVWLPPEADGSPSRARDVHNRDPELRERRLLGLQIMSGFRPTGANEWGEGEIYNPDDGRIYEPSLTLREDGKLELEACILFICQSEVWRRVE